MPSLIIHGRGEIVTAPKVNLDAHMTVLKPSHLNPRSDVELDQRLAHGAALASGCGQMG